ncbi:NAD(P)-binding domain-containing protein [Streptomyces sp. 900116325]
MEHLDVAAIGGGPSDLAAAYALRKQGLQPTVLEASGRTADSWPHHYDSLTLFSLAGHSSPRDLPFGGDTERYPHSDEAIAHLLRYANQLDADIRTGRRVSEVRADGDGFALALEDGSRLPARAVVAATGSFGQPNRPTLSGLDSFTGTVLHVADDQAREPFAGQRIVVGGGNSAVQVQPNSLPTPVSASPAGLRSSGSRSAHWAAKTCASGSRPPGWTSRRSAAFSALPPPWRSSTTVDTKRLSLRLHPIAARCSPASRAPR